MEKTIERELENLKMVLSKYGITMSKTQFIVIKESLIHAYRMGFYDGRIDAMEKMLTKNEHS